MVGNPNHDPKTGEFTSGHGASGHNAGGGNRDIAKQIVDQHNYNHPSVTERHVYAAVNQPIDNRWKVWAEAKIAGSPIITTEDVYATKRQAVKAIPSYAKNVMGWKKGQYYKSVDE